MYMENETLIRTATGFRRGEYHMIEEQPCQDYTDSLKGEKINSVALSDGAGSRKLSHFASKKAVDWGMRFLVNNFEYIWYEYLNDSDKLINTIADSGRNIFLGLDIPYEECCCTLLAVAVHDDGRWIAIHIGDGGIFIQNKEINLLSKPENGTDPSVTYFLNEDISNEHIRLYVGQGDNIKFLLTSDGCFESLYDLKNACAAPAVGKMLYWLDVCSEEECEELLAIELEDTFAIRNEDDLSIAMISYAKK